MPLPRDVVERYYSTGVYAWMQPAVTTASNAVPWAVLDLQVTAVAACLAWWQVRRWRRPSRPSSRGRWAARLGRAGVVVLAGAAAGYLVFLACWGLNYQRVPIESRLDFDPNLVTTRRVVALARQATAELNALHGPAHSKPWPELATLPDVFGERLTETATKLGLPRTPVPGVAKRSLLGPYFQWASVAGMTNPFALEVLLNPDTLPFERYAVLAHEWAHLAGFANEAEANLVAWLLCRSGDEQARYSGWLSVWPSLVAAVPRSERPRITRALGPGPRADYRAIVTRSVAHAVPVVRDAAWKGYDVYLKSQRVEEGIASYGGVVRLMAGMKD